MLVVKSVRKPDMGNPRVGFDKRGGATGRANDSESDLDSTVRLIAFPLTAQINQHGRQRRNNSNADE